MGLGVGPSFTTGSGSLLLQIYLFTCSPSNKEGTCTTRSVAVRTRGHNYGTAEDNNHAKTHDYGSINQYYRRAHDDVSAYYYHSKAHDYGSTNHHYSKANDYRQCSADPTSTGDRDATAPTFDNHNHSQAYHHSHDYQNNHTYDNHTHDHADNHTHDHTYDHAHIHSHDHKDDHTYKHPYVDTYDYGHADDYILANNSHADHRSNAHSHVGDRSRAYYHSPSHNYSHPHHYGEDNTETSQDYAGTRVCHHPEPAGQACTAGAQTGGAGEVLQCL